MDLLSTVVLAGGVGQLSVSGHTSSQLALLLTAGISSSTAHSSHIVQNSAISASSEYLKCSNASSWSFQCEQTTYTK